MAEENKDIFSLVFESERQKIFEDLIKHRGEVHGQIDKVSYVFYPLHFEGGALECELLEKAKLSDQGRITLQFKIRVDQYYIETDYKVSEDGIVVFDTEESLYILQRRQNFRVNLPAELDAYFQARTHNGKPFDTKIRLADISATGSRLEAEYNLVNPNFAVDDILTGFLHLGHIRDIDYISMQVRHISEKKIDDDIIQSIGLQFYPMNKKLESVLISVVMEIQRKYFGSR